MSIILLRGALKHGTEKNTGKNNLVLRKCKVHDITLPTLPFQEQVQECLISSQKKSHIRASFLSYIERNLKTCCLTTRKCNLLQFGAFDFIAEKRLCHECQQFQRMAIAAAALCAPGALHPDLVVGQSPLITNVAATLLLLLMITSKVSVWCCLSFQIAPALGRM